MSGNIENNFYMKSHSHLPSLASTLLLQPALHSDITLVTWAAGEEAGVREVAGGGAGALPLVLPAHQALLLPHLPALAGLLCPSCSPHDPLVLLLLLLLLQFLPLLPPLFQVLLLPDTPILDLKAALQTLYLEGNPDNLNRVLGFTGTYQEEEEDYQTKQELQDKQTDSAADNQQEFPHGLSQKNKETLPRDGDLTIKEQTSTLDFFQSTNNEKSIMKCNICDDEFEKDEHLEDHRKWCNLKDWDAFRDISDGVQISTPPKMTPNITLTQKFKRCPTLELPEKFRSMIITENPGQDVDFTISNRGGTIMLLNGFLYGKYGGPKLRKDGVTINWTCIQKTCLVNVITKDGIIQEIGRSHKHGFQRKEFEWNKNRYDQKNFAKNRLFFDNTHGTKMNKTLCKNPFVMLSEEMKDSLIKRNPNHRVKFTISQHGGTLILLDDFLYMKNKGPLQRKNGLCIYWTCFNTNCKVRLLSEDGTFTMIQTGHDHESTFNCFERYQEKEKMQLTLKGSRLSDIMT